MEESRTSQARTIDASWDLGNMAISKGAFQQPISHFFPYQSGCDFVHTPTTRLIINLLKLSSRH
jgi:hypothetical protein